MEIVAVAMGKGGTGKTTVANNLAVMHKLNGHDVLLVDADTQMSATGWADIRRDSGVLPLVTSVIKTGKIGADLVMLAEKFGTVVVDVGGRDTMEMRQAIAVATQLILPIRPSLFDTWTVDLMLKLIEDVEERTGTRPPGRVLLNAASASTNEIAETREALADYATLPVMKTCLMDRVAFRRAARAGLGVWEYMPDSPAAIEMKMLYEEVFSEEFKPATQRTAA
jgi:chromosome partitioning protein